MAKGLITLFVPLACDKRNKSPSVRASHTCVTSMRGREVSLNEIAQVKGQLYLYRGGVGGKQREGGRKESVRFTKYCTMMDHK